MARFLRTVTAAFLCFAFVIGTGAFAFIQSEPSGVFQKPYGDRPLKLSAKKLSEVDRKDLSKVTAASARVNILVMGSDGGRSDTMMLLSFDPAQKLIDVVSIPRDTYNPMPEHQGQGAQKLNAVYGFKGDEGGPAGVAKQVSKLLDIPVDYYLNIDYQGVREVVDILGGIPVVIESPMNYDDAYDKPPLHIHFDKGEYLLSGADAVKYLRWRKNNGEEGAGDLGRIQRQQDFVKTAMGKALSLKLPQVITSSFRYIKTDMPIERMLRLGIAGAGVDLAKLNTATIPGEVQTIDGLSCYVHDPAQTRDMMLSIYNRTAEESPAAEE